MALPWYCFVVSWNDLGSAEAGNLVLLQDKTINKVYRHFTNEEGLKEVCQCECMQDFTSSLLCGCPRPSAQCQGHALGSFLEAGLCQDPPERFQETLRADVFMVHAHCKALRQKKLVSSLAQLYHRMCVCGFKAQDPGFFGSPKWHVAVSLAFPHPVILKLKCSLYPRTPKIRAPKAAKASAKITLKMLHGCAIVNGQVLVCITHPTDGLVGVFRLVSKEGQRSDGDSMIRRLRHDPHKPVIPPRRDTIYFRAPLLFSGRHFMIHPCFSVRRT